MRWSGIDIEEREKIYLEELYTVYSRILSTSMLDL